VRQLFEGGISYETLAACRRLLFEGGDYWKAASNRGNTVWAWLQAASGGWEVRWTKLLKPVVNLNANKKGCREVM